MLARPGIRETVSVTRPSIKPAITKLWPSPSSILVSILRDRKSGNGEAVEGQGVGVVQGGYFRLHVDADGVVFGDTWD